MEKINVAELLKDCPKGMELDCTIFDDVTLDCVTKNGVYIRLNNEKICELSKFGNFIGFENSKCIIFPKGKTTWEGFVPPCKFKDGDIVSTTNGIWIGIVKRPVSGACETYVTIYSDSLVYNDNIFCFERFATEEEKARLFQAIKDNGYKWNEESKTLDKLIEPKFKVGDRIRSIKCNLGNIYNVIEVKESLYVVNKNNGNGNYHIDFEIQDEWELVPNKFDITTLVPFESRVLVRNDERQYWIPAFWGYKRDDGYTTTFGWSKYCVPFDGNERLLRTSDDCDEFYKNWE